MSALSINPSFPIFTSIDGQPLENGYIYVGASNLDPQTNPINVYWDAALTQLAVQPIRTRGGYPVNSGTPARLYVNSNYSIRVMNKNGSVVYSAPAATERYSDVVVSGVNAEDVIYDPPFFGGVQTNVEAKLAQTVSVKDFGAVGDGVTDDTAAIQAAVTACPTNGAVLFPPGTYLLTAAVSIPQRISLVGYNRMGSAIVGNFDGALITASGQLWRNTIRNLSFRNNNAGSNAACLKATFYQASIQGCTFEAQNGYGIKLLGTAYCVENEIRENYFYQCKHGIHADNGTYDNTDAFVVDNYFYGNGYQTNSIYWYLPSGTTFRGNHFYGGAGRYFMELVGGTNVSVSDSYFESDDNPRVNLTSGNPGSYTFTGNKFLGGNGSNTDLNGDQSSLFAVSFNLFNPGKVTFSGNIFESGTNSVPVFNLLNGGYNSTSNIAIEFDSSNIFNGSYALAISGASGTNTDKRIVVSDHVRFNYFSTAQSTSPSSVASSEFFQQDSGFATGFPVLPNDKNWLSNKKLRINNISTAQTMQFSTGATGGISGNKSPNPGYIAPGGIADLMLVGGNYYFLHIKV